jgi:hypothetical protein
VPRYFLHLRFSGDMPGLAVDEEGDELPNEEALRQHVLETARDLIQTRSRVINWRESTLEVTNEAGHRVLTLALKDAVP